MPSGSAKQTTLHFTKEGQSDASKTLDNRENNEGQQHDDDDEQISAGQSKRPRTDLEMDTSDDDTNRLNPLTTDGSTTSLFSSNSRATIKNVNTNNQDGCSPREYRPRRRSAYPPHHDDDNTERIRIV